MPRECQRWIEAAIRLERTSLNQTFFTPDPVLPKSSADMKVVRSYSGLHKAHLDKSLLEANDIPVELRHEAGHIAHWATRSGSGGVSLAVPEECVEDALNLIGRQTEESRKRVEQYDRQFKRSLLHFVVKVAIVAVVLFAVKGFKTSMLGPCIGLSVVINIFAAVVMLLIGGKSDEKRK